MPPEITFLTDKSCLDHKPGLGHPEQPIRLKKILNWLDNHPEIPHNNTNVVDNKKMISLTL